jgi:peptidyl-prolyl cis-trans isomerase B (cyclophilin B)
MKTAYVVIGLALLLGGCASEQVEPKIVVENAPEDEAKKAAEEQEALDARAQAAREIAKAQQAERELAAQAAADLKAAEEAGRAKAEAERLAAEQAEAEAVAAALAAEQAAAEKAAAEAAAAAQAKQAADKAAADKAAQDKAAAPAAAAPQDTPVTSNSDLNVVAVMETSAGTMTIGFYPDVAPGHVKNFVDLARKGFYDGTRFHRIMPSFMIQGGDPNTKDLTKQAAWGTGDPGYKIKAEFNNKPHVRGTLSMARSASPDSAGSQFFICHARAAGLDNKYTVFGELLTGYDVLDKIATAPSSMAANGEKSRPVDPVTVTKVTIRARTPEDVKKDG